MFAVTQYEKDIEFAESPSGKDFAFAFVFAQC